MEDDRRSSSMNTRVILVAAAAAVVIAFGSLITATVAVRYGLGIGPGPWSTLLIIGLSGGVSWAVTTAAKPWIIRLYDLAASSTSGR